MRVHIVHVDDPKEIRKLIFRDIKRNRRNIKLKILIQEVRKLRKQLNGKSI